MQRVYIDPLSGSIVLQVLAAGVLSLLFNLKRTRHWLGGRLLLLRDRLWR